MKELQRPPCCNWCSSLHWRLGFQLKGPDATEVQTLAFQPTSCFAQLSLFLQQQQISLSSLSEPGLQLESFSLATLVRKSAIACKGASNVRVKHDLIHRRPLATERHGSLLHTAGALLPLEGINRNATNSVNPGMRRSGNSLVVWSASKQIHQHAHWRCAHRWLSARLSAWRSGLSVSRAPFRVLSRGSSE